MFTPAENLKSLMSGTQYLLKFVIKMLAISFWFIAFHSFGILGRPEYPKVSHLSWYNVSNVSAFLSLMFSGSGATLIWTSSLSSSFLEHICKAFWYLSSHAAPFITNTCNTRPPRQMVHRHRRHPLRNQVQHCPHFHHPLHIHQYLTVKMRCGHSFSCNSLMHVM